MKCLVNGEPLQLREGSTVRDLLQQMTGRQLDGAGRVDDGDPIGLAVAVSGRLVPRSRWSGTAVAEGAEVEVVEAVQGG